MNYYCEKIGNIINRISVKTEIDGYTEGIIEPFFPSRDELEQWNNKQHSAWIKVNNKRMEAICKFLNENEL